MGAHAEARDAARGVGGVEEGRETMQSARDHSIVTVPSSLRRGNDNNACGRLTRNVIRGRAMSTKTLFSLFVAPAKAGSQPSRRGCVSTVAVIWLATLALTSPPASWAQGYNVTLLDFPSAIDTFARGINDRGIVVGGYALPAAPFRGFVYNRVFSDFVVSGSTQDTQAWAINNVGHIVGRFQPDGQDVKGFFYDGTFTTIDFPGATRTEALGINERGQVVGAYSTDATHGFLYSEGTFFAIDVPGSRATFVFDINSSGDLVGVYDDDSRRHGFVYRHGVYEEVSVPGSNETIPTSINEAGEVAGYTTDSGGKTVGFIFSHGAFVFLDLPEANRSTRIFRVNARGQVVGDIDLGIRGFVATPIHGRGAPGS